MKRRTVSGQRAFRENQQVNALRARAGNRPPDFRQILRHVRALFHLRNPRRNPFPRHRKTSFSQRL